MDYDPIQDYDACSDTILPLKTTSTARYNLTCSLWPAMVIEHVVFLSRRSLFCWAEKKLSDHKVDDCLSKSVAYFVFFGFVLKFAKDEGRFPTFSRICMSVS